MTKSEKNRDYAWTFFGGWKSVIIIAVPVSLVISLIISHGFSENWAWEIAKSIITIDGIILGFTFLNGCVISWYNVIDLNRRMVRTYKGLF